MGRAVSEDCQPASAALLHSVNPLPFITRSARLNKQRSGDLSLPPPRISEIPRFCQRRKSLHLLSKFSPLCEGTQEPQLSLLSSICAHLASTSIILHLRKTHGISVMHLFVRTIRTFRKEFTKRAYILNYSSAISLWERTMFS